MPLSWQIAATAVAAAWIAACGTIVARKIAARFRVIRAPGGRHLHAVPTPLLGGVGILLSILVVTAAHPTLVVTPAIGSLLGGIALFLVLGVLDDRRGLSWRTILAAQFSAALLLLAGGVRLAYVNHPLGGAIRLDTLHFAIPLQLCGQAAESCTLPLAGSALLVIWVIAVVNAFNWLDGSDGVASSVALASFVAIAALALRQDVVQPPIAILAAVGAGAVLGFLPFNLPPAQIFLGSAGSFGVGFAVAALAVLAGAKFATVGMALLLPSADAAAVLVERWRRGKALVSPGTMHLHHLLAARGWPSRKILALHLLASACFGSVALALPQPWKTGVLVSAFLGTTIILVAMKGRRAVGVGDRV